MVQCQQCSSTYYRGEVFDYRSEERKTVDSTRNPQATSTRATSIRASARRVNVRLRPFPVALFVFRFLILTFSPFFVHTHPRPYPIYRQLTQAPQTLPL